MADTEIREEFKGENQAEDAGWGLKQENNEDDDGWGFKGDDTQNGWEESKQEDNPGTQGAPGTQNPQPQSPHLPRSPPRSPSPPPRPSPPPPRRRNENPPEPNETLGVFGLSIRTREIDLEDEFNRFGRVDKVTIVYDQRSDRSRGFGFIKMASIEDADKCIQALNGVEIHGRNIRVDFSATKRPHSPTPGQYMGVKRASTTVASIALLHAVVVVDTVVVLLLVLLLVVVTTTAMTGEVQAPDAAHHPDAAIHALPHQDATATTRHHHHVQVVTVDLALDPLLHAVVMPDVLLLHAASVALLLLVATPLPQCAIRW
ncbi:hypothetical protein E3P81_03599 [Wallemia ichthyophaga]|nr:hypothetical protein E3P94_03467 [Wallemia ichthyophaga]TIB44240.1 hypothetical protein E3P82_03604 [Wallemia ichthyophaga]TIB46621.1 hypothetical protein E3P81_03599 [Wallemia ichthyophaga]TIB49237.1 hypothetical protein E3P80_03608 [Wallemia ichthyophaga]TIB56157.1 hypothetical protein E3P79_03601 [Wallemia ichthyophaga]